MIVAEIIKGHTSDEATRTYQNTPCVIHKIVENTDTDMLVGILYSPIFAKNRYQVKFAVIYTELKSFHSR